MKYTIINTLTGSTVLAPVLASAVHSYLASYKAHHDRLTIYAETDTERAEGMSAGEWLAENTPGSI